MYCSVTTEKEVLERKVISGVINMLLCILLFNHDTKPSRKDFSLKYFIFIFFFFFVTGWTTVTVQDIRNDNTL